MSKKREICPTHLAFRGDTSPTELPSAVRQALEIGKRIVPHMAWEDLFFLYMEWPVWTIHDLTNGVSQTTKEK